jgi:hypothetical protein
MSAVIPAVRKCVASYPPLLLAATCCLAVTESTDGRAKRAHDGGRGPCIALVTATLLILGACSDAAKQTSARRRSSGC